ncbi:MAG: hypothetical protein IBJ18_08030 [Phycisphaerales bacterium]|nr:hypothetical protein [Phycisphaerales bacterium]
MPMLLNNAQTLLLAGNQRLVITRTRGKAHPDNAGPTADVLASTDVLELLDPQGQPTITIRVSSAGAVVELGARSVTLNVQGDLGIAADNIAIHARESLNLSSAKDLTINANETLRQQAKRQAITSTLGDIDIRANDDVKVDGERIRMNC